MFKNYVTFADNLLKKGHEIVQCHCHNTKTIFKVPALNIPYRMKRGKKYEIFHSRRFNDRLIDMMNALNGWMNRILARLS